MASRRVRRSFVLLSVLGVLALMACTTEPLDIGPNGDSRLRFLNFQDRNIIPEFKSTVYSYTIFDDGEDEILGMAVPFMSHTKVLLNGVRVRMQTNAYALPDMTDLTAVFTNDGSGDRILIADVIALDGNMRTYTVKLKSRNSDGRILSVEPFAGQGAVLLRKAFKSDFGAPFYSSTGTTTPDVIEFSSHGTDATLNIKVANSSSLLAVPGAGGTATVEEQPSNANGGVGRIKFSSLSTTARNYTVTCTPPDNGAVNTIPNVNTKIFRGVQVQQASDARIIDLEVRDGKGSIKNFLPYFDYEGTPSWRTNLNANGSQNTRIYEYMTVVLDDTDTVSISGTLANSSTTLTMISDINGTETSTSVSKTGSTFALNDIKVTQGERITLRGTMGSRTINYRFEFRLFEPLRAGSSYGFDGGLRDLIKDVYTFIDMPRMNTVVTGVLTMINIYPEGRGREGWYMEDGAYGLYVWSWNGFPTPYNPVPRGTMEVGQKIRMAITGAKIWQNLPEVTQSPSTETKVLDENRSPIYYLNGNTMEFSGTRQLARILRFSTQEEGLPIMETYNSNGIGSFTPVKNFKFFFPYTKGLRDIMPHARYNGEYRDGSGVQVTPSPNIVITHVTEYMKRGMHGTFFGPLFVDGEGHTMVVKDKCYMIVP